jgi:2'-5' RNA ligase
MRRLFVALRPPEQVRDALLSIAGGVEGARWQSDDLLHLTLRFAGDVSRRGEDDLVEALSAIEHDPFTLQVRGVGHFEKRGRVNGLWAAFAPSPALASLQRKVERACKAAGLAAEPRTFVPHVTLARLGGRAIGGGEWLARHGDRRTRMARRGLPPLRKHAAPRRFALHSHRGMVARPGSIAGSADERPRRADEEPTRRLLRNLLPFHA